MKKLLFVPIETKVREFEGKLLFSLIAAERGYQVLLGSQSMLQKNLYRYRPGIYIDKSISVSKAAGMQRMRRLKHRVTAWDEEGLVYFDLVQLKCVRLGEKTLKEVDLFFAWGDAQLSDIRTVIPGVDFPAVVTGNPRTDILRPDFVDFYKKEGAALKKQVGPFILINTGFPFPNHFLSEEDLQKTLSKYPVPEGFFENWTQVQREGMASFQALIPKLHEAFPGHQIVVRPHPSENHQVWKDLLKDCPRCRVTGTLAAVQWIAACDLLIHCDCTTGIEAFLMGVPSIAYRNVKSPGYLQPLPNALSYRMESEEETLGLATRILSGEEPVDTMLQDPDRLATARYHMAGLEGKTASDRILDALDELEVMKGGWIPARFRHAANDFIGNMQRRMRKGAAWGNGYLDQKFSGLSYEEVEASIQRLADVTDRFKKIKVKPGVKDCFYISSK